MYRYQHYNINPQSKKSEVLNVNNDTIFTGSEKQCRTWIDREWNLSQKEIKIYHLTASYIGDDTYRIYDGWGSTILTAQFETEIRKVEDVSGMKKYKLIHKQLVTVTLSLGYRMEYQLKDIYQIYGGRIGAIKKLMQSTIGNDFDIHCQLDLENDCRKSRIGRHEIIGATMGSRKDGLKKLYRLLREK